jgi:hypothetical protein
LPLVFLLVAVVVLATSLTAAVLAARSPILRKWVWVVFALLGAPGVTVDWNTGEVLRDVAIIEVPSVRVSRPIEPGKHRHLTVAFPLGAVIFLARRRRLVTRAAADSGGGAL